jgi:hypothetical protein
MFCLITLITSRIIYNKYNYYFILFQIERLLVYNK